MKNNNNIIQKINSKKYDIISFGYFPNFLNNKINYKEYNLSVFEDEDEVEEEICNKTFKKINKSKSSSCKKLIKKKQLSKSSNVIATLILPKLTTSNTTNENSLLDHDDELMMKLNKENQQQQENKNKFTWVYYQFDYYGKRKTIYDDSNNTTNTTFPEKIICSKCCSLERSLFKLNNGNLDCSYCLNYSELKK